MSDNSNNTKDRIIRLARERFAKAGYSGVKTTELAEELGISKRTLYKYFTSKKELFDYIVEMEFEKVKCEMEAMRQRIKDEENADFISELSRIWNRMSESSATFTKEFHKDVKKNLPETYRRILRFRKEQIQTNFRKIHRIGVKKGYIKEHIHQRVLYQMHQNCLDELLKPEVLEHLPCTTREILNSVFEVLLFGALTGKGREEFEARLDSDGAAIN